MIRSTASRGRVASAFDRAATRAFTIRVAAASEPPDRPCRCFAAAAD